MRQFNWEDGEVNGVIAWAEDGIELPKPKNGGGAELRAHLADLGAQGWELVGFAGYSDNTKVTLSGQNAALLGGIENTSLGGYANNGLTTTDRWVLKRPK